jgi:ceramide glucosyltransferase
MATIGLLFLIAAGAGMALLAVMLVLTLLHLRRPAPVATDWPGISVLKPLCGVDDALAENLETFVALPYPGRYEVVLGVRSTDDAAYPLACATVRRWPGRVRLVLQDGEAGVNPKVNQLVCLARAARHGLLVVSDSNVRVPPGYLLDIAGHLGRPGVGCVTHPVAGGGHRTLGALLDNLHLGGTIAPGMVCAQRVLRKDLVVGKSMALWRHDLERLGGFASVANVLAEDHVLGNRIGRELGARVAISSLPVLNVAVEKSVGAFFQRYLRWSVTHRTAISFPAYLAESLLNPIPLAVIGFLLRPGPGAAATLAACAVLKPAMDSVAFSRLRQQMFCWRAFGAGWVKDALLFAAWVHGLHARTVVWRGNRLRVLAGGRLLPLGPSAPAAAATEIFPPLHGGATPVWSNLRA